MEHCPSGDFSANAAWMCCAVLAHNLIRWSAKLGVSSKPHAGGRPDPADPLLLGPRPTRQPIGDADPATTHWPWARSFTNALTNLRAVTFAPT